MDFQLKYKLVQQTPMIHFQHDQKGATLRATEVKPKLDKFIIEKMGGKEKVPENWFIGDTQALNYKMRICAYGKQDLKPVGIKTDYDIFYGNMGSEKDKFKAITGDAEITFICFVSELKHYINDVIAEFFIISNFGTMQSKGFGSYIVDEKDISKDIIVQCLTEASGAECCYCFSAGASPFKDIKTLYGVMKSGYNINKEYQRSYLFEYCHNEYKMGNEKAAMKKFEISPYDFYDGELEPVRHPENKKAHWDQSSHPYMYVRALLGVGETIEYIEKFTYGENKKGKMAWLIDGKVKVEIKSSTIERCASPIRFKIINGTVYMYANRINNDIFDKEFIFKNKKTNKSISLQTPKDFNIDKFLQWFVGEYNKTMWIKNDKGNTVLYSIRKRIERVFPKEVR